VAIVWSRRDALKVGGVLMLPLSHDAFAAPLIKAQITRAAINVPVASIYSKGDVAWAITKGGQLWERGGGAWRVASETGVLDADAPLVYAHGRLCARSQAGALWVREAGSAKGVESPNTKIAPHSSFAPLAFAVIAVASGEKNQSIAGRFEGSGSNWRMVAGSNEPVLPDARPIQIDLDGALANADDGQIAVLAGPDDRRYRHGVLGDAMEATRILYLERHSLKALRTLSLPAPYVFEDVALRPVKWMQGATERTGLLTVRSGPQGAQLCVVAASLNDSKALEIVALGAPIGTANRWMAPSTDGERIVAVHTPHIGGVFHAYQRANEGTSQGTGASLTAKRLHTDVSTHAIHSRVVDLTVWLHDRLIMPSQNYRRLHVFEKSDAYAALGSIELPDSIVAMAAMPGAIARRKFELLTLTREGVLLEINQP
jgi:hypothetical protein